MAHRPHRVFGAGLVLVGVLAASACDPPTALSANAGAAPAPAAAAPDASAVTAELNALPVRAHSSLTGYSREAFGPAWSDAGSVELAHNRCPTRQDILSRDLTYVVRAQDGCTVVSGVLHDPYTGETIAFRRGPTTSLEVQIDHLVPLGLAWQSGARDLTAAQRLNLANDPSNLAASSGRANAAKGAKDASQWLPPRNDAHCWYASAQVRVKAKYRLSVSPAEKQALGQALASCPAAVKGTKGSR
jgi:hypothetical protein